MRVYVHTLYGQLQSGAMLHTPDINGCGTGYTTALKALE